MKTVAVIALSLCTVISLCSRRDTERAQEWRPVEPRLTGDFRWQPCPNRPGPCGQHIPTNESCVEIRTHQQALRVLVDCTDAAIVALERFAPVEPDARSDLAAAYYYRAKKQDRPQDLLKAWDAVESAPRTAASAFNRALIGQALGLEREALASWDAFLNMDSSEWAAEARGHQATIGKFRDSTPVTNALGDFHQQLTRWASDPSQENLDTLRSRTDPYSTDVVAPIERANDTTVLRRAIRRLNDAIVATHDFNTEGALAIFEEIIPVLERSETPILLYARARHAIALSYESDGPSQAAAMLQPIEAEARKRNYSLLSFIYAVRSYASFQQGRVIDAINDLDTTEAEARRIQDWYHVSYAKSRRIGYLREIGQLDSSWRQAIDALPDLARTSVAKDRHFLLGEIASTALALGHPRVALLYQDRAIEIMQGEPASEKQFINLAIAFRKRAEIQLALKRKQQAAEDVRTSLQYIGKDPNISRSLETRAFEVQGQILLESDPRAAAAVLTEAIQRADHDEFRTARAALRARRAEAYLRAGRMREAEADLRDAVEHVRAEEAVTLRNRVRGEAEDLWGPYFSRFQDTYRLLIRQLMTARENREAFAYAEQARAVELLDLIGELETAPPEFRAGRALALELVQKELPAGTFILQYAIAGDVTYAWIISRYDLLSLELPVSLPAIERWSSGVQNAVRLSDDAAFDVVMRAAYAGLLEQPMAKIATLEGGVDPRLVIVPDGPMHGLPFAALRNATTTRYLTEDATVSVAGSATLAAFALRRDAALVSPNPSVLVIGDPAFNEGLTLARGMDRLAGAKREAAAIKEQYGARAEVLVDTQATGDEFLKLAPHHTIIHIAAHAIVSPSSPTQSFILFAPSMQHSGALNAKELMTGMKLDQTKLVVLAACSSAGGSSVGPAGVAPLVRPLIAAGVPAVIGSLWDVNDATVDPLMVSFHRHYRQGKDVAAALRAAQRELLGNTNPGLASVFAWAPFQVIGHGASPFGPPQQQ